MKKIKWLSVVVCLILTVTLLAGCPAQPANPTSSITPSDGGAVTPSTNPSPGPSAGPTVGKLPETQVEVKTDPATTVFVDAVKGNDANAGTVEAPVKTLAKAQELVRSKNAIMRDDIVVYLRGGTYVLDNTLTFTQEDSGKNGYDVIWTAYKGENVVISGGSTVSGWTLHDKDKNIWVASANGVKSYDFYVNGERATVARGPKIENASINRKTKAVEIAASGAYGVYGDSYARVKEDMVLTSQNLWVYNYAKIDSVVREGDVLRFVMTQDSWRRAQQTSGVNTTPESLLYFENAYEFLDTAGEWYLNAGEDKVYYIPKAGEDLTKTETVLGKLEKLVDFNGDVDKVVENITVTGMTFKYSTWLKVLTSESLNVVQSNVYRTRGIAASLSAVWGQFVNNVNITHNVLEDLGSGAVHLWRATKNSSITNNVVRNCAGNGISLGAFQDDDHHPIAKDGANYNEGIKMLSENNVIADNRVSNIGEVYKAASGIFVGYVARTKVEYNTLTDLPYSGISFGWGWGFGGDEMDSKYYTTADGKFLICDNSVCYNYIENIMNVMFDGGGIYTLGRNENTLIKGNYINLVNNDYGGIYLDNGSCGFTVTDNVISNAHRNWIYKGDSNFLYDNYTSPNTAKQPDLPMKEPAKDPALQKYKFENNYMWDEAKVNAIKNAAGVRW